MPLYGPVQQQQASSPPPNKERSRGRVTLLIIAILLTVVFVVVGIFTQGWGSNVSLILSGVSVLLGFFPLLIPLPGSPPLVASRKRPQTLAGSDKERELFHKQLEKLYKSSSHGALVLYSRRPLVGSWVYILNTAESVDVFAYIAEHTINRQVVYAAVFYDLAPDVYRVRVFNGVFHVHRTTVAVQAGQVTELYLLSRLRNYLYGWVFR